MFSPLDTVANIQAKLVHTMADIAALPGNCRLSRTRAATLRLIALGAVMGTMLVTSTSTIALAIRVARLQAIDLGSWLPLLSVGTLAGGQRFALMTAVATRLNRSATMVAAMRATCRG